MKIAYIVPGSGGSFYCENCMRDSNMLQTFKEAGHEIIMVPLYLPVSSDTSLEKSPVFFGAVSLYLKEMFPFLHKWPKVFLNIFDSPFFLKLAAKAAGTTNASGTEKLTISMLKGENGSQKQEFQRLSSWLVNDIKPDIIHISNILLIGLASSLKSLSKNIPVVCSLQDEDQWLCEFREPDQQTAWDIINQKTQYVDFFISVSQSYLDYILTKIPDITKKTEIIPLGIHTNIYSQSDLDSTTLIIGFLSRMSEAWGLGILSDAFIELKKHDRFKQVQLWLTGGMLGDDKKCIKQIQEKLNKHGLLQDLKIFDDFSLQNRINFLKSLSVLSVPMPRGIAFGRFQLEALASGVPVVQPDKRGFHDFILNTGGGILYDPNEKHGLKNALLKILSDSKLRKNLGKKGREAVAIKYDQIMVMKKTLSLYQTCINKIIDKDSKHAFKSD